MSPEMTELPYLLDFYPLQDAEQTRIHPFFDHLRDGRLTTTRCPECAAVLWQPRVVCPRCNHDALEWVDLPTEGTLYASTVVFHGLPLGMEDAAPLGIGIVELDTSDLVGEGDEAAAPLRILSRLDLADGDGTSAGGEEVPAIGDRVRLKVVDLPDGRVFYRFEPV